MFILVLTPDEKSLLESLINQAIKSMEKVGGDVYEIADLVAIKRKLIHNKLKPVEKYLAQTTLAQSRDSDFEPSMSVTPETIDQLSDALVEQDTNDEPNITKAKAK